LIAAMLGGVLLVRHGMVAPNVLCGAISGLLIGIAAGLFLLGPVLSCLTESLAWLAGGLVFGALGGTALGIVAGATELDTLYAVVRAALQGGVFGGLTGMVTGYMVGRIGGALCPGAAEPDSFGGALGATFRLLPPGGSGSKAGWGIFAGLTGVFP